MAGTSTKFARGGKLFIPRKAEPGGPNALSYLTDMQAIEKWAIISLSNFPDFKGTGTPNGVLTGKLGQWYEDIGGSGGLWVCVGSPGPSNNNWLQVGGFLGGSLDPGISAFNVITGVAVELRSKRPGTLTITDVASTANALIWLPGTADGLQQLRLTLGSTGQFIYTFKINAAGTVSGLQLPDQSGGFGAIFVNAGNPNGSLTSFNKGDICIDDSTPAIWQATAAASTAWTQSSNAVSSVTAADGTVVISPTTGAVLVARAALTGPITVAAGSNVTVITAGVNLPGSPTTTTQSPGDNSTHIATTAYVDGTFAPLASPSFTGTPGAPTAPAGNVSLQLANTTFVANAVAGWVQDLNVWTRTSATTYTIPVDEHLIYLKGTKLQWKESGAVKFGVVGINSTFGAGVTTVTMIPTTDYALVAANPDVGSQQYSFSPFNSPPGFPVVFNFTPVWVGFSASPTASQAQWAVNEGFLEIILRQSAAGTSNSTSTSMTWPLNFTSSYSCVFGGTDNNAACLAVALTTAGSAALSFGKSLVAGAWTATGVKGISAFNIRLPL